jgi:hypothetical protein
VGKHILHQILNTMRLINYPLAVFLSLVLVSISCDKTDSLEESEWIKKTLITMWDAIEKEDMERYASYIHPDFTQFGETDPVLRIGKDAELAAIREWVAESENIHTEMLEPRVTSWAIWPISPIIGKTMVQPMELPSQQRASRHGYLSGKKANGSVFTDIIPCWNSY